jgi:ribonucleoside-diphosphate reductase alpha chain
MRGFTVFDAVQLEGHGQVRIDRSADALLTDFGKATLDDRYLLPGESYQDLFARVARPMATTRRMRSGSTTTSRASGSCRRRPVLSNGGTTRGLPISCFLNEASDSLEGIVGLWNENVWLAAKGGGIGSYWGNLRGIGEKVGRNGKTSGVIPFIRVMDSLTLAISQGSLRRGSAACYLPVHHPEIEEFLEMRRPTGGDPNRKALNLHHGVLIPDAFMRAVEADEEWALVSPKDGALVRKVSARSIWIRILTARIETGEPYIIYSDHVNRDRPEHHKLAGLEVKTSNLCSEITLPTGLDQHGMERTAVCCLSSLNLETWFEWQGRAAASSPT